jgi:hypothetical protein
VVNSSVEQGQNPETAFEVYSAQIDEKKEILEIHELPSMA